MREVTFYHRLPPSRLIIDRAAWITAACRGKRVVHIGCVDSGLTEEKIGADRLLHGILAGVCDTVVGVDIDADGLRLMAERGIEPKYLICGDLSEDAETIVEGISLAMGACDLILCPEVLEHVPNPGAFLSGVKLIAAAFSAPVIVTVPNAFGLLRLLSVAMGIERVHSDHRAYYSWRTLSRALEDAGLTTREVLFYSRSWRGGAALNATLLRWKPQLADGLLVIAHPAVFTERTTH